MSDGVGRIYSDAQKVGRMWTYILAIFFTVIGLTAIIGGFIYVIHPDNDKVRVMANIISMAPYPCSRMHDGTYICNMDVDYSVEDKKYKNTINYVGDVNYQPGNSLYLWSSRKNPNNLSLYTDDDKTRTRTAGIYGIIGGLFVIALGWISYWLTKKYDFIAAGQGVGAVGNLVHNF